MAGRIETAEKREPAEDDLAESMVKLVGQDPVLRRAAVQFWRRLGELLGVDDERGGR